jgi:membrane protein DedA with SNARE-associated domain
MKVMQIFIDILSKIGVLGLVLTMAVEGLSVPIPGILVVLTLGYILNLSITNILLISFFMSLAYCIASLLPYRIGYKLESVIRKKYEKQIIAAQKYFNKYGEGSIALLRPFAAGNFISYFAGMSKVKRWRYTLLTFLGIYPWCAVMLFIGKFSRGNIDYALKMAKSYSIYFYIAAIVIILIIVGVIVYRYFTVEANK